MGILSCVHRFPKVFWLASLLPGRNQVDIVLYTILNLHSRSPSAHVVPRNMLGTLSAWVNLFAVYISNVSSQVERLIVVEPCLTSRLNGVYKMIVVWVQAERVCTR